MIFEANQYKHTLEPTHPLHVLTPLTPSTRIESDLSANRFSSIPGHAFVGASAHPSQLSRSNQLVSLNLKGNPIQFIAVDAFLGLNKLKTL